GSDALAAARAFLGSARERPPRAGLPGLPPRAGAEQVPSTCHHRLRVGRKPICQRRFELLLPMLYGRPAAASKRRKERSVLLRFPDCLIMEAASQKPTKEPMMRRAMLVATVSVLVSGVAVGQQASGDDARGLL